MGFAKVVDRSLLRQLVRSDYRVGTQSTPNCGLPVMNLARRMSLFSMDERACKTGPYLQILTEVQCSESGLTRTERNTAVEWDD